MGNLANSFPHFDIEEVTIPNIPLPDDDDEEFDLPNNSGMLTWPADSGEMRHAYHLTETNELISICMVESTFYEAVRVFWADTGMEITL